MFGGIPSLLHVHNIDVKHRPELHLDFLHQERSKLYRRQCSAMKTTQSALERSLVVGEEKNLLRGEE